MNRSSTKDSLIGRNMSAGGMISQRRGMPFNRSINNNSSSENYNGNHNGNGNGNTDLFNRNRTSVPVMTSSDESNDLQARLARLSVGSGKPAKSILDDLLVSNEGGKNDYDWLLTPPGTPLVPSSDGREAQPTPAPARSRSSVRSSSINKSSRLSVAQSESNYPSRPARSSSVTRPSISTTPQYTSYSSRNTNILNTSSASVSSYIRPSTPTNRSSTTARPSTPSARSTPSRGSTPSRTRPSPAASSNERTTRPSQSTRPSTPGSRPQTPGTMNSPTIRAPSRPSTPTRRSLTPSLSTSTTSSASAGRTLSSTPRTVGSNSRPSSPSPRVRPTPQPINHADFSHETPPNLRTTLPDRPLSAGRSRPGGSTTAKGNLESSNTGGNITRRHSSPIVNRGRIAEPPGRGRPHVNGHTAESLDPRRTSHLPDSLTRKPIKSSSQENVVGGFGRNISKKSLDMAIKHMDIRNGGPRLSGSTLFPQSIRSSNSRAPGRASSAPGSVVDGQISNGITSENGSYNNVYSWNRGLSAEDQSPLSSKLSSEVDIYESSRYDAILLKEDLKNTSWLHSADDKIDEGSFFENGFESLPEPFGPL